MERNTAEALMRVYAAILWLFGIALIVAGVAILLFGSQWVEINGMQQQLTPPIPSGVFTLVAVIFLLLAAADIIIGIGVWNHRPWARTPAIVLSVIHLFSFPFGTAFGIFGLWLFVFDHGIKAALGAPVATTAPKTQPAAKRVAKKAKKTRR